MDHCDWTDEAYAQRLAAALAKHVVPGGRVIWRSAALEPSYATIIAAAGFQVQVMSQQTAQLGPQQANSSSAHSGPNHAEERQASARLSEAFTASI